MPKDVWIGLDYDGATGMLFKNIFRIGPQDLYEANPKLNEHIKNNCGHHGVLRKTGFSFSFRQGPENDRHNMLKNGNGSSFKEFDKYSSRMEEEGFFFDCVTLQDYAYGKPAGSTWQQLRENNWPHLRYWGFNTDIDDILQIDEWFSDTTKVIEFFILAWHAHFQRLPDCELVIQLLDDTENILEKICWIVQYNPLIFPPDMLPELFIYRHILDTDGYEREYTFEKYSRNLVTPTPSSDVNIEKFDIYSAAMKLAKILKIDDRFYHIHHHAINLTLDMLLPRRPEEKYQEAIYSENDEYTDCDEYEKKSCCTSVVQIFTKLFSSPPAQEPIPMPALKKSI